MKTLTSGRGVDNCVDFFAIAATSGSSRLQESAAGCPLGRSSAAESTLAASECWCAEKRSLCYYLLPNRKGWIDAI